MVNRGGMIAWAALAPMLVLAPALAQARPLLALPPEEAAQEQLAPDPPHGVEPRHHHHAPETIASEEEGITVTMTRLAPDPLRGANAASFTVSRAVDDAVIAPVAHGYEHHVPKPARDGIHNALRNLREPLIAVNFLLQHRIGKSAGTVARFAINSTIGVAGLFDVARRKPFHLPRRENSFADTMGFYGIGPGPYLFLPLIGSTTLRDLVGRIADRAVVPIALGKTSLMPTAAAVPLVALGLLDKRVENDKRIIRQREDGGDLYAVVRDDYLRRRKAEIDALHGYKKPKWEDDEPLTPASPLPALPLVSTVPAVTPPVATPQPAQATPSP